jgi:hypothetical protein
LHFWFEFSYTRMAQAMQYSTAMACSVGIIFFLSLWRRCS